MLVLPLALSILQSESPHSALLCSRPATFFPWVPALQTSAPGKMGVAKCQCINQSCASSHALLNRITIVRRLLTPPPILHSLRQDSRL